MKIIDYRAGIHNHSMSYRAKCLGFSLSMYFNNKTETCWPSYETLIEKTGMSRMTLRKAMKELEAEGFVEITTTNSSNRYKMTIPQYNSYTTGSIDNAVDSIKHSIKHSITPIRKLDKLEELDIELEKPTKSFHEKMAAKEDIQRRTVFKEKDGKLFNAFNWEIEGKPIYRKEVL